MLEAGVAHFVQLMYAVLKPRQSVLVDFHVDFMSRAGLGK